ncbi:hypothetical protein TNCV_1514771 [Trichonephila clavipes]|nr:hypothetical protein TNCV_1514771 [Trichonephila clavipes]
MSISNDVEVCAPVNGDATIHQHSPPPNLTLSCTNAGLFLLPRSLQMKISLLSGWTEKRDSSEKEHCSIHFSSSSHALLPTPCGSDDALMLV